MNETGIAGTIIKNREPDEKPDEKPEEDQEYSLADCAKDILDSIKANDHVGLADALKEAFQKMDSEPHREGEDVSPHSYEAQNQAAAKGQD